MWALITFLDLWKHTSPRNSTDGTKEGNALNVTLVSKQITIQF